jgi:hypothetical protein
LAAVFCRQDEAEIEKINKSGAERPETNFLVSMNSFPQKSGVMVFVWSPQAAFQRQSFHYQANTFKNPSLGPEKSVVVAQMTCVENDTSLFGLRSEIITTDHACVFAAKNHFSGCLWTYSTHPVFILGEWLFFQDACYRQPPGVDSSQFGSSRLLGHVVV